MGIRRVVTGHDATGKAVFASDEVVEPITVDLLPQAEFFQLWGADVPVRFPDGGGQPSTPRYFPPVGGFRFGLFSVAPDSVTMVDDLDFEAALVEFGDKLPGLGDHLEADHPGMHTTATVDYEFVVSGRCVLELDDGATRELGPGDTVVQNGTRHAWRNPYDVPCLMVVAIVGAHHDGVDAHSS
jgi:mannose-6-phosphate isomerase-like protein (cupin superfamily)